MRKDAKKRLVRKMPKLRRPSQLQRLRKKTRGPSMVRVAHCPLRACQGVCGCVCPPTTGMHSQVAHWNAQAKMHFPDQLPHKGATVQVGFQSQHLRRVKTLAALNDTNAVAHDHHHQGAPLRSSYGGASLPAIANSGNPSKLVTSARKRHVLQLESTHMSPTMHAYGTHGEEETDGLNIFEYRNRGDGKVCTAYTCYTAAARRASLETNRSTCSAVRRVVKRDTTSRMCCVVVQVHCLLSFTRLRGFSSTGNGDWQRCASGGSRSRCRLPEAVVCYAWRGCTCVHQNLDQPAWITD